MTAINSNRAIRGPVTAVPVVAGKGVRLVADTENNRWIVEADETVLWSDNSGTEVNTSLSLSLSEAYSNFERIRLVTSRVTLGHNDEYTTIGGNATVFLESCQVSSNVYLIDCATLHLDGTAVTCTGACRKTFSSTTFTTGTTSPMKIYKIVGINRIQNG